MLQEDVKNEIKKAMLSKDKIRLEVLRSILASCMNELVNNGRKPQDILSDEETLAVITRLSKQRKDSIDQFTKGGRMDLVDEEQAQLAILETFLPKLMEKSEIEIIARNKKESLGISDPSKKGILMSEIMKELKGKADGSDVKSVVDNLF